MDYIYHYTTLPSLVSMIKNNQLRLMRLDKFVAHYDADIPYSKTTPHLRESFENIYVSSWINDSTESLSKWKLFSNLNDGIRIRINTHNVFNEQNYCEINKIMPYSCALWNLCTFAKKEPENRMSISIVHTIDKQERNIIIEKTLEQLMMAGKIREYYELFDSILTASVNPLSSQNEIRLQIKTKVPVPPYQNKAREEYNRDLKKDDYIHYIMASLPNSFFEDMEILVSPNFSEENLILLQSFLSKCGLKTSVRESILTHSYKSHIVVQSLYQWK